MSDTHEETILDQAFSRISEEDEKTTALFYDALLASTVYLPITDDADCATEDDGISPRVFTIEDQETMVVFDSLIRMAGFLDKPSSYVEIPGQAVIEMISGKDMHLALNLPEAPSAVIIPPSVIDWIYEATQHSADIDHIDVNNLMVTRPEIPSNMLAALAAQIMRHRARVDFSALVNIVISEKARLVLILVSEHQDQKLADELSHMAQSFLKAGDIFEVTWLPGTHAIVKAAERQGIILLEQLKTG